MFLRFDSDKAIQAIGVLARCHRLSIASKLRVLKLVYIAERESLRETGYPILGCRAVAMDHGPLHSAVLNLINGEHIDEPKFSQHFDKFGVMVQLCQDPGVGKLSRYEIEKLQEVSERYATVNDWCLAHDVTHGFPEWKKRYVAGTSTTITFEDILEGVGRSDHHGEIISEIVSDLKADELFGEQSR